MADGPSQFLILGDFGGKAREPIAVDRDNFDDVLAQMGITINGTQIRELEDFHPDRLYSRLDVFQDLRDRAPAQSIAATPSAPKANIEEILRPSSLLDTITGGGDAFDKYVRDLARASAAPARESTAQHDDIASERMRAVLHHPRFQALEAAWRGLDFAVRHANDDLARVHIAQFSRQELEIDLSGEDLRATRLYSLFHGRQWNVMFGLYSFDGSRDHSVWIGNQTAHESDLALLGKLALIAGHAKVPFITEGSVDMGEQWDELRSIPEARFLGLAVPRVLMRLPYGAKTSPIESFEFEEMPDTPAHNDYLWGNPAFACLAMLASGDSMELDDLPVHTFQQDGEWTMTPPSETWMTESQVRALIELGLMPLVSFRDTGRVRLAGFRAIDGSPLL